LDVCQHDGGLDIGGAVPQLQFPHYIVLHPAQLLGHVPCSQEAAKDVLPLALRDELEGVFQGFG